MFETPLTQPHRFIVPLEGVNTFCTFRDGKIVPENALPMVGFLGHAIDPDFGWVAWIADEGRAIGRVHLDAIEGEHGFASLPMPEGYKAGCLLFHKQVLFVGGNCGKEVIGRFDFSSSKPEWVPLEVPEQFRRRGKTVDDLLLDGDRLIAVDNCIDPKYLLLYDVTDPRFTNHLETRNLSVHGTYEEIVCGALGPEHMALLSRTSSGYVGEQSHISVYARPALSELCSMAVQIGSYRSVGERVHNWRHVAVQEGWLLIAGGMSGVGVLNLDTVEFPSQHTANPADIEWVKYSSPEALACGTQCLAVLKYQPLPERYAGRAVTRVVPMPGTGHYLAVVDTEPGFDTVVMELP